MKPHTLTELERVVQGLQSVSRHIQEDTAEVHSTGDHLQIIQHFDHVRIAAEQIKEAREAIKEVVDALSTTMIPDAMKLANVKTVTVIGVGRVTVSHRFSCSMLDKALGIPWLKDNGLGGIVQETVNAQTLAATAKNLLETEGRELPPDIFKVGTQPFTSITKVK